MTSRAATSRRTEADWIATVDRIAKQLDVLRRHGPTCVRRDAEPYVDDGWPTSTQGGDGGGSGIAKPTEATGLRQWAVSRGEQRPLPRDEVHELVMEATSALDEALGVLMGAAQRVQRIIDVGESKRGRTNVDALCANAFGCPDDRFSDRDHGRCSACANYRRLHDGRDRRKTT